MRLGRFFAALSAASLSVTPALAAPVNPAASLSLAPAGLSAGAGARASSGSDQKDDALALGVIAAIIIAGGIITAIVVITVSDNSPDSP